MNKGVFAVLGLSLIVLAGFGFAYAGAVQWYSWLTAVFGVLAALYATPLMLSRTEKIEVMTPVAMSIALFIVCVAGIYQAVVPWLTWWTFTIACAYLFLGILSVDEGVEIGKKPEIEDKTKEYHYKKSA